MESRTYQIGHEKLRESRHAIRNWQQTFASVLAIVRLEAPAHLETLHRILADAESRGNEASRLIEDFYEDVMDQQRLRIALIEDDRITRLLLSRQVVELGHQLVGEAEDGPGMVELLLETHPDVVLFDIHLPGPLDGLEAFGRAVMLSGERPAGIALTGDPDVSLVLRAMDDESMSYLVKPIDLHQLRSTILMSWGKRRQLERLRSEAKESQLLLEQRKQVERAKAKVMRLCDLDEPSAWRVLHVSASDSNRTVADLSAELLDEATGIQAMGFLVRRLPDTAAVLAARHVLAATRGGGEEDARRDLQERARRQRVRLHDAAREVLREHLPAPPTDGATRENTRLVEGARYEPLRPEH